MQTPTAAKLEGPEALGYVPMDDVHAEFLVLVRKLSQAHEVDVPEALEALVLHTREHFALEDEWMESTAFPARQCHADEHAAVMASMEGVQRRVRAGEIAPARSLAAALDEWFPAHA